MLRNAALSAAIVLVASCASEGLAHAEESSVPAVEIAIVGAASEADELGRRIESWFRADHAPVESAARADLASSEVLAGSTRRGVRVWIVLLERKLARVFFTVQARPGEPPRYLVTEVALEHSFDEVDRERLAQVVYLSANGLWAGTFESSRAEIEKALGTNSVEPPPENPTPISSPPPRPAAQTSSLEIRTGLEYAARWTGDPGLGQLVGGNLRISRTQRPYAIGGIVRASAIVPQSTSAEGVALGTHGMAFGLGTVATHSFNRRAIGMLEAGLGLEIIRYRTTAEDQSLRAAPDATTLQPFASGRVGVRLDWDPVGLELQGILAVSMLHTHFDVERTDRRTAVIVPWLVQPGIAAGVSW